MFLYNDGSNQVKIVTHDTFDERFTNLPTNTLSPMCQHFQILKNNERHPLNNNEINSVDHAFFITFAEKEVFTIPVLPNTKDTYFGFILKDDELFGCT